MPRPVFAKKCHKSCCRGGNPGTLACLTIVIEVSMGMMLPVEYFCYNKFSFLCQSNFMESIELP